MERILITGASGGIGRACALNLAQKGISLVLHYHRNQESIQNLKEEIASKVEVQSICFDLTNKEKIIEQVEPLDLDGMIHTASSNSPALFLTLTPEEIEKSIRGNLIGTIILTQIVLKKLFKKRKGNMVFFSSIVTKKSFRGQALYAMEKGGMETFVRALAKEYGNKGIRANLISPGPVNTKMLKPTLKMVEKQMKKEIPLNRIGEPEEIAHLVAFLMSKKASFITGVNYVIDGGYTLG